jgi:hypothetical protein
VVLDKAYPIMSAEQKCILNFIVIIPNIRINDDDEVAQCVLSPKYARVFTNEDILELNAEPDKFKLF